jgi:RimJ/RimL family protein N-acetyltransferase
MDPARVRLRPLEPEDVDLVASFHAGPEQRRVGLSARPESTAERRKRIARSIDSTTSRVFVIEAAVERASAAAIGDCGLHRIDAVHRSASIHANIADPAHRGRGVGARAVQMLVAIAFRDLGLHRLELEVVGENPAAVRCYEKAGFSREGVRRAAAFHDGAPVDVAVMALLGGAS